MNSIDEEDAAIERLLRRFRPVGPASALRSRVLSAARRRPARVWPLATAAAAALAIVIASYVLGGRDLARLDRTIGTTTDRRVAEDLAERLGGDETARQTARWILIEQELGRDRARSGSLSEDEAEQEKER